LLRVARNDTVTHCHCEERSDEAIPSYCVGRIAAWKQGETHPTETFGVSGR